MPYYHTNQISTVQGPSKYHIVGYLYIYTYIYNKCICSGHQIWQWKFPTIDKMFPWKIVHLKRRCPTWFPKGVPMKSPIFSSPISVADKRPRNSHIAAPQLFPASISSIPSSNISSIKPARIISRFMELIDSCIWWLKLGPGIRWNPSTNA